MMLFYCPSISISLSKGVLKESVILNHRIDFKVAIALGNPPFPSLYPLSCHPRVPLPSPPPVPLTFIGPKFGWHHGNQGSQGTLPG